MKFFTCWNQLLTLMFGQLSNRESLRDLIVALDAHHGKCYHLGVGKNVPRSNLSKANEQRDYRLFEVDLCLNMFRWAKFRRHKGGVKVLTLLDLETQVPTFVRITKALVHEHHG